MKIHELHYIVLAEAICLSLIIAIVISAFKRWKKAVIACSILATIAFYSAWSTVMATGSVLVFGSASTLLWWQQGPKSNQPHSNHIKILQRILWGLLAAGVATLIINNIRNIISYLG